MTVSADVLCGGIGLYADPHHDEVFRATVTLKTSDSEVMASVETKFTKADAVEPENAQRCYVRVLFDEAVLMSADTMYTITSVISTGGANSACGSGGQDSVVADGITFSFFHANESNNGTDVRAGQIPVILYQVAKEELPNVIMQETTVPSDLLISAFAGKATESSQLTQVVLHVNDQCIVDTVGRHVFILLQQTVPCTWSMKFIDASDVSLVEKAANKIFAAAAKANALVVYAGTGDFLSSDSYAHFRETHPMLGSRPERCAFMAVGGAILSAQVQPTTGRAHADILEVAHTVPCVSSAAERDRLTQLKQLCSYMTTEGCTTLLNIIEWSRSQLQTTTSKSVTAVNKPPLVLSHRRELLASLIASLRICRLRITNNFRRNMYGQWTSIASEWDNDALIDNIMRYVSSRATVHTVQSMIWVINASRSGV